MTILLLGIMRCDYKNIDAWLSFGMAEHKERRLSNLPSKAKDALTAQIAVILLIVDNLLALHLMSLARPLYATEVASHCGSMRMPVLFLQPYLDDLKRTVRASAQPKSIRY